MDVGQVDRDKQQIPLTLGECATNTREQKWMARVFVDGVKMQGRAYRAVGKVPGKGIGNLLDSCSLEVPCGFPCCQNVSATGGYIQKTLLEVMLGAHAKNPSTGLGSTIHGTSLKLLWEYKI